MNEILLEIDRKNLVGKTKAQSPERFNKRLSYKPLGFNNIDFNKLMSDDLLVANIPIGDYISTVAFKGVMKQLLDVVQRQPRPNITLQSVIRALGQAIDKTDVLVNCTCADFIYRYAYWATKFGYKYGKPETRPPEKTNPHDDLGAMCKHLTALLSNKKWLVKVASIVNDYIKLHIDDVRYMLNVSPEEFIVNVPGRPSTKTGRNVPMTTFKKPQISEPEELPDEDELEPIEPEEISDDNEEDIEDELEPNIVDDEEDEDEEEPIESYEELEPKVKNK